MKWLSRKLVVLIIATLLVYLGKIDGWQWVLMASAYLGMNVLDKIVGRNDTKGN